MHKPMAANAHGLKVVEGSRCNASGQLSESRGSTRVIYFSFATHVRSLRLLCQVYIYFLYSTVTRLHFIDHQVDQYDHTEGLSIAGNEDQRP